MSTMLFKCSFCFNPRTPRGVRPGQTATVGAAVCFNPRTPRGVRPYLGELVPCNDGFQSTHPSRGATFRAAKFERLIEFQSTHPSRGATVAYRFVDDRNGFQSTHPSRGATCSSGQRPAGWRRFNPRTPRGVRHEQYWNDRFERLFQSTHPSRGATRIRRLDVHINQVSIHAPLAGCDKIGRGDTYSFQCFNPRTPRGVRLFRTAYSACRMGFNPRTPRGVRPDIAAMEREIKEFQSTHPSRGATMTRRHRQL